MLFKVPIDAFAPLGRQGSGGEAGVPEASPEPDIPCQLLFQVRCCLWPGALQLLVLLPEDSLRQLHLANPEVVHKVLELGAQL